MGVAETEKGNIRVKKLGKYPPFSLLSSPELTSAL
jgi:hypothetical protein